MIGCARNNMSAVCIVCKGDREQNEVNEVI